MMLCIECSIFLEEWQIFFTIYTAHQLNLQYNVSVTLLHKSVHKKTPLHLPQECLLEVS